MAFSPLISLLLLVSLPTSTLSYICHHESPSSDSIQTGFSSSSSLRTSPYMVITWHNTEAADVVPGHVLAEVTDYVAENVLLPQASTAIHLSRNCPATGSDSGIQTNLQTDTHYCDEECAEETMCGLARVPDEHLGRCYVCVARQDGKRCGFTVGSVLGEGIQSHLVIYLTSRDVERCGVDPVQASHCQVSPVDKRPIAGYINICPNHNIPESELPNILIHQLFHIMGISKTLFSSHKTGALVRGSTQWGGTRDEAAADPLSYRMTDVFYEGAKSSELVENHFQCYDKGYGVLMENQDPEYSHIEERLFRGEGMTVNVTSDSVFSDLTYSILEDTGWYIPARTLQPPFPGGTGCDIIDRSCGIWVLEQTESHDNAFPFCSNDREYSCNREYSSVHRCQSTMYDAGVVPTQFQYHTLTGGLYEAGPYEYSDYCMLFDDHDRYQCNAPDRDLTDSNNLYLERFGEDAMCVLHDGEWDINGAGRSKGAGCYSICCRENNFDIIDTNGQVHSCYKPKQTVHVSSPNNNIRGSLQCPDFATACGGGNSRPACKTAGKCMTPSITNGQVYSSQGMYQVTIGTTLSYLCYDRYTMKGSSSSVCLGNNRFSEPAPECKLPCREPVIENGAVIRKSGTSEILIGDVLTIGCDVDHFLDGSSSMLTCTLDRGPLSEDYGYWSPTPPTCVKGYLEWSIWGPCSVSCGTRQGERIRTRGCSNCADFEYESEVCFANTTCQVADPPTGATNQNKEGTTVILISVFGVFFLFAVVIIIFIVWFFNKAQQNRSQTQLFNESYYYAQKRSGHGQIRKPKSMDLSSEYSITSGTGSMKQLFVTPPTTPHSTEAKITSQSSEESVFSGKSFHIPKVKYKNRARVFPKNIYPPSYRDSLIAAGHVPRPLPVPPQPDHIIINRDDQKMWATPAEQRAQDAAKLRASILAARNRVRNHPSFRRLVVPEPFTSVSYNPNRIPFEISEGEEDNYLEDSWDRRHRVGGLKMIGPGAGNLESARVAPPHFEESPFTEDDVVAFELPPGVVSESGGAMISDLMMVDGGVIENVALEDHGDIKTVAIDDRGIIEAVAIDDHGEIETVAIDDHDVIENIAIDDQGEIETVAIGDHGVITVDDDSSSFKQARAPASDNGDNTMTAELPNPGVTTSVPNVVELITDDNMSSDTVPEINMDQVLRDFRRG